MKIGIIKETKKPFDSRVAFTPSQALFIKNKYKCDVYIQKSESRAIKNIEYADIGLNVTEDLSTCDLLFGIKEVDINELIPNKHYIFFGHIAKLQEYNKPLLIRMMELGITFTDYEYLINEKNQRVVAFGWWAGAVGVYNTIRAWGLKYNSFKLEKPHNGNTLDNMIHNLREIQLPPIKILVTGDGRVSTGAQYVLDHINIKKINPIKILNEKTEEAVYSVLPLEEIVSHRTKETNFDFNDFKENPSSYTSNFMRFATKCDMLISCHYWGENDPIYLSQEDLRNPNLTLKVIGDVTCDIMGSIKSTLRASSHENPFYDYNVLTENEEPPFSSDNNLTIMAIDTLPNALPIDTSISFGEQLINNVIPELLSKNNSQLIENATILKNGKITERFSYLKDFIK